MLKNEQQDFVKVDCRIDSKDWSDSQSSDQKRCLQSFSLCHAQSWIPAILIPIL